MFDGHYLDWNRKRIKGIIDFYGFKFFFYKRVLDLGCGYADISGALFRLGADIVVLDARQDHLKMAQKKYPGIKAVQADLDNKFPFSGKAFDIVLDLDLLCHLYDYEKHLRSVCAITNHLVLETAVMDDLDSEKFTVLPENKNTYDLSVNGVSCRPTSAAIERILSECGFNFRRVDSNIYNSNSYKYDWISQNDGSCDINKRRLWFAVSNGSPIQFRKEKINIPNIENVIPPIIPIVPNPLPAIQPVIPNIPPPETEQDNLFLNQDDVTKNILPFSNITLISSIEGNSSNEVKKSSLEYSLIKSETFSSQTFEIDGVILPTTLSSRLWIKKIYPMFPGLKISKKALTMREFNKSSENPNVVLCSINNLMIADRIWIEEWGGKINESQAKILENCKYIMTPSLINAQQILQFIPHADVNVVNRPWAMLNVDVGKGGDYFLYFEKNEQLTRILFQSWKKEFGKILVVGSSIILPEFANHVSNNINYGNLLNLLVSSQGLIDLSENYYYQSGILELARGYQIPIITNNYTQLENNQAIIVSQDREISAYPTPKNIQEAIQKFNRRGGIIKWAENYNNNVNISLRKMMGVG